MRIAVLGDSQETSPFGWGSHYLPHLNARFARAFGPAGESNLFTCVDAAAPPHWLGTSAEADVRVPAATLADEVLPSIVVHGLLSAKGAPAASFRTVLLHDASRCIDPVLEGGAFLVPGESFVAEVLVRRIGTSPGVLWQSQPVDGDLPDAAATIVASGLATFERSTPAGAWAWIALPELGLAGRRHLQIAVRGASAKSALDVAGVRFRNPDAPRGIVVQSFSKGGMRLPHLVAEHGGSGAFLRSLAPQAIVLCYGANDAGNLTDVAVWRAQLVEAIAWIRGAMKDPGFPIIIASELPLAASASAQAMLDAMPVVAHELALADPRLLALNLPRIVAEEYGWGEWRPYLADAAHYRAYAQRLLAEAFVGELCRHLAIEDPGCAATNWSDCVRTWGSACMQGGCRMIIDADVEALGLEWNGAGTTCADLDFDGAPDACPPAGPADVNRDGFIDALDLAYVLSAWGTDEPAADVDQSGLVDALDLATILASWSG